jgi:hypothetical protein
MRRYFYNEQFVALQLNTYQKMMPRSRSRLVSLFVVVALACAQGAEAPNLELSRPARPWEFLLRYWAARWSFRKRKRKL